MPRVQVYLPDDLYEALKERGLPASELLQEAVRAELERRDAVDALDAYLSALAEEVGEPGPRQMSRAEAVTQRLRSRTLHQAG
jgi:Arc/MetJ-type ribon-helix-helix transcriptional regulator